MRLKACKMDIKLRCVPSIIGAVSSVGDVVMEEMDVLYKRNKVISKEIDITKIKDELKERKK